MMIFLEALWLILPAYIANSSAVAVGGGTPVDFGKTFKNKPIFGKGKTWRGFLGGILIGTGVGSAMALIDQQRFGGYPLLLLIVFCLSAGALLGDLAESFFKRQLGKKRGEKWLLADQLDFLLGAWFVAFIGSEVAKRLGLSTSNWFLEAFSPWQLLFLLIFTPFLHYTINILGYKIGIKETPW
jgi:CDP-2,3-bis-(O-geranylgeranyl)-sn-glycerol synthase